MPLFPRSDRRYRVLYDAHAWAGVLAGLALYVMFTTGVVALFWEPLEAWEEPAQHAYAAGDVDAWWTSLAQEAPPDAHSLYLALPKPEHGKPAPVGYIEHPEDVYTTWVWSGDHWTRSRAHAAGFLFSVHFLYHRAVPQLYDVAGLLSVALLFALVTGVGIHLRDLLPQLHRFRPQLRSKLAWSDLHKVTAVVGLPFQALFAYSGAVLILGNYAIGAVGTPLYGGDLDRAKEVAFGADPPAAVVEDAPAEQEPTLAWIAATERAIPELRVTYVRADHPGRSTSRVRVGGRVAGQPGYFHAWVDGPTAEVVQVRGPREETAAGKAQRWIFALHFAQIGGWGLKAAYGVLALATAATILTGNGLWLARRRRREERWGDRLLARLTIGIGAGTPIAIATTLLGSLALPIDLGVRELAIELGFVVVLGAACVTAGLGRDERAAWASLLALGGAAFAVLPVAQGIASGAGLVGNGSSATVVAVDLAFLLCAGALVVAAWWVARGRRGAATITSETPAPAEVARG